TPLNAQAVFAEEKAVVAREDNDRVVEVPRLLELRQNLAQTFIDGQEHLGPIANALLTHPGIENVSKFAHDLLRLLSLEESLNHDAAERSLRSGLGNLRARKNLVLVASPVALGGNVVRSIHQIQGAVIALDGVGVYGFVG